MGFWVFLVHPPMASVLLSASVERCFVSRMRDFLRKKGGYRVFQVVIGEEKSIRRLYRTYFKALCRPAPVSPVKIRDRERDRDR